MDFESIASTIPPRGQLLLLNYTLLTTKFQLVWYGHVCSLQEKKSLVSNRPFIATIDGTLASGKSTVIQMVGERLIEDGHSVLAIDNGSLFRALALLAQEAPVIHRERHELLSPHELVTLAEIVGLGFLDGFASREGRHIERELLYSPELSALSSAYALSSEIRDYVLSRTRAAAYSFNGFVLNGGRDGGTYAFPEAECKLFLTVSDAEAARRYGIDEEQVRSRNNQDRDREHSPMLVPVDALIIDTTSLSIAQVVERVLRYISYSFA